MPKNGLTEIVTIIDKSGSMSHLKSKTIEGFNKFLNEQKTVDEKTNFSLILFSSPEREQIIFDSVDIKEVNELNVENYKIDGSTALYDAIGKTIRALKKRIKNIDEDKRPDRVLFVILTDGGENSSVTYDKDKIFKKINKMENENGWSFIYLGANQDAFEEGSKMGIKTTRTLNYTADDNGLEYAYMNISNYTKNFRKAKSSTVANNLNFENIQENGTSDKG